MLLQASITIQMVPAGFTTLVVQVTRLFVLGCLYVQQLQALRAQEEAGGGAAPGAEPLGGDLPPAPPAS